MSKNHFVSHFLPFQINTTIFIFVNFFFKMAVKNHFVSHFWPFQNNTKLWITFLAILDQYRFFFYFEFFYKMAAGGHFGCPKITFDLISGHFRSIHNLIFVLKFLTKWLPSTILDVRNSLWITFLAILDQYRFFIFLDFFYKMAAGGHFGCLKITFDLISGHFISILNRKSLLISFLFFFFFLQNGCRWPFWMSENHFRSHFYHIDTQLFFFENF